MDDNYRPLRGKPCPALTADGYAHHPYDLDHAPRSSDQGAGRGHDRHAVNLSRALNKLRSKMKGTRNIYLTEFGYASSGPHKLPESTRALYLKQAIADRAAHARLGSSSSTC